MEARLTFTAGVPPLLRDEAGGRSLKTQALSVEKNFEPGLDFELAKPYGSMI
jgi:hypothetical protein